MIVIDIPLSVPINKYSKFTLNLNYYRNTKYILLNLAKQNFNKIIKARFNNLNYKFTKVRLTYIYYPATNRKVDISNICSIADKFFSDALVKLHYLEDDNYNYIPEIIYKIGNVDKLNPRIEVIIEPL